MFKTIRIRKSVLIITAAALCLALWGGLYWFRHGGPVFSTLQPAADSAASPAPARVIDMVTGEFESKLANGKLVESYRWDPGTIVVERGETVTLRIRGISGDSHPFFIDGLDVKGTVEKGKVSSYTFTPTKAGTYRIVCLTHQDAAHDGPMIGYLVVH
jgi:heme/copper-type cytochrome/quinol oxidase subunit 2